MNKINQRLIFTIALSESIHIFCCALPTLFSVLGMIAGLGFMAALPAFIVDTHEAMHHYELPLIITSGVILVMGWALYWYSRKIDCRTDGACSHEPCTPKKDRTRTFMIIATVTFIINLSVYFLIHR